MACVDTIDLKLNLQMINISRIYTLNSFSNGSSFLSIAYLWSKTNEFHIVIHRSNFDIEFFLFAMKGHTIVVSDFQVEYSLIRTIGLLEKRDLFITKCTMYVFFFRFLIDSRWFGQLKKYLGLDHSVGAEGSASAHPGPIDNGPLFKENPDDPTKGEIKDGLIDELEYVLVPEEAWTALVEEFGLTDGQTPISRKVRLKYFLHKV